MAVKLGFDFVIECKEALVNAYRLLGYHEEFELSQKDDYTTRPYLPDTVTDDAFKLKISTKKGREITLTTKFMPINLDSLQDFYVMSSTALDKFSIGIVNKRDSKYTNTDEAIIKSYTLEIPENDIVTASIDFSCESITLDSDTDYADGTTITHGVLPTTEPLSTLDLDDVYWGATLISPSKLTLKLEYDVKNKWDVEAQKMRYYVTDRKVSVDLDLTDVPTDFMTALIAGTAQDLTFTLGTQTITVKNVRFPELKTTVKAADLVSETFSSVEASEITFDTGF